MLLGIFQASLIPFVSFTLGVGSILVCYYLSQLYHHQKPFPDTWISATAGHYPEFIIFRIGTISGSALTALSQVLAYFWVKTLGYEKAFNIGRHRPELGTVMGIAGSLFLMGSTALIDTGRHNSQWHVFCAGNAFLWQILSGWYHTYIGWVLYSQAKATGLATTVIKIILSAAVLLQLIIDANYSSFLANQFNVDNSRVGNILEYSIAFTVYGFYLVMGFDLKGFRLAYKQKQGTKKQNPPS